MNEYVKNFISTFEEKRISEEAIKILASKKERSREINEIILVNMTEIMVKFYYKKIEFYLENDYEILFSYIVNATFDCIKKFDSKKCDNIYAYVYMYLEKTLLSRIPETINGILSYNKAREVMRFNSKGERTHPLTKYLYCIDSDLDEYSGGKFEKRIVKNLYYDQMIAAEDISEYIFKQNKENFYVLEEQPEYFPESKNNLRKNFVIFLKKHGFKMEQINAFIKKKGIFECEDEKMTFDEIAKVFNCSSRTIKNWVKAISNFLNENKKNLIDAISIKEV